MRPSSSLKLKSSLRAAWRDHPNSSVGLLIDKPPFQYLAYHAKTQYNGRPGHPPRPGANVLVVIACAFFAFVSISCGSSGPATERRTAPTPDDSPIGRAFTSGSSNVQVEGEGRVTRVLPDDLNGGRHQRFVVRLASGQTLLVAHNIDIAPRIDGLKEGDSVGFKGEYVWNKEGGVIHWTHHDPEGRHVAGWVKHNGQTFK
ncbi:MAG: DUF3465 domain-containing protein [Blastocatellia bacterium]|nr:DUF3465 domain-containing protein [Blastocatellia bacterium]